MAVFKNDIGPISGKSAINTLLVVVVLLVGLALLAKPIRSLFSSLKPTPEGQCAPDPNYKFKDPAKHPTDC